MKKLTVETVKKKYKKYKPTKIIIDDKNKQIRIQVSKITNELIKERKQLDVTFLKQGYSVLVANKI
jgi:regulatory protein YycH of two-component signal transduction system YycFG